jgi:Cu+-exporting ATPase
MSDKRLQLTGISCAGCVRKVEGALNQLPGVATATVNFADRTAHISGSATDAQLVKAVIDAGYGATVIVDLKAQQKKNAQLRQQELRQLIQQTLIALVPGALVMLYGMVLADMMIHDQQDRLIWGGIGILTLVLMVVAGRHFFINAWRLAKNKDANMDSLIALGTGAAWLYSSLVVVMPDLFPHAARHVYYEASLMIIGFVNLGRFLEVRARGNTSQAIEKLLALQPANAWVKRHDKELQIPVEHLVTGDLIRIRPGEAFVVDGELQEGQTLVDESMLTGEPMPVKKQPGSTVSAGTLNQNGSGWYTATQVGENTLLAAIIQSVQTAQGAKLPIARMADNIAAWFVPTVIVIALLAAIVWFFVGPEPRIAYTLVSGMTVLIIACPCALGLATPMSVMVGVGKAAQSGLLIRNGDALQHMAQLKTVVFDKTGTLTRGKPTLQSLHSVSATTEDELLAIAWALEKGSAHHIAWAIVEAAKSRALEELPVTGFDEVSGKGVRATIHDQQIAIGNRSFMEEAGVQLSSEQQETISSLQNSGATVVFIASQTASQQAELLGWIVVADSLKEDAASTVKQLQQQGIQVVMLSGDNHLTVNHIASQLGITEVHGDALPQQKLDIIQHYQQQGLTAMVGDGINDAPALAQADVGIAIGAGTAIAIESADVTLLTTRLQGLLEAIHVSRATMTNIKQNLFGAFIYNVIGIPIAAGLLYPFTGSLLSPVFAGAAMAMSSVTVVMNANRLHFLRPLREEKAT